VQIVITNQIHVAILDDDPTIRTALVRLLEAAGMVAHAHATSNELFESVMRKCPDCLLLDLQMPEMDGPDVLKYLNQRDFRVPTIIITGRPEKISREARMSAEIIAVLRKPLEARQLIQLITEISAPDLSNAQSGPLPLGREAQTERGLKRAQGVSSVPRPPSS
jgi:FixJ family two-component response regulator